MVVEIRAAAVIANVNVERAVTIHVRNGDRGAGQFGFAAGKGHVLGEMPFAVVDEQAVRAAARRDDQIEMTIAIDVRERRGNGVLAGTRHARTGGDVLETPVAEITVENI